MKATLPLGASTDEEPELTAGKVPFGPASLWGGSWAAVRVSNALANAGRRGAERGRGDGNADGSVNDDG